MTTPPRSGTSRPRSRPARCRRSPAGSPPRTARELLADHFDRVERRTIENGVRVDEPDALVATAPSLPLDAGPRSAFEPEDADALRERVAARIEREGAIEWRKDLAPFVAAG